MLFHYFIWHSCREAFWEANGYKSANISLESEGESDEEEEEPESRTINYVVGDVTHPKHTQDRDAFVVHCVGTSQGLLSSEGERKIFR